MNDIQTRTDVEKMVSTFYEKVKADELLTPAFANVYWPHHLPVMYNFWASILLGEMSYHGSPLTKHIDLHIETRHFDRWIKLFNENLDAQFAGPVAEEAKNRAGTISNLFQHKMGLMKDSVL
jgi:hemoglobin